MTVRLYRRQDFCLISVGGMRLKQLQGTREVVLVVSRVRPDYWADRTAPTAEKFDK